VVTIVDMGILMDKDGKVTRASKSFGNKKGEMGVLRIVLHNSETPCQP
jgi:hypothetical protein